MTELVALEEDVEVAVESGVKLATGLIVTIGDTEGSELCVGLTEGLVVGLKVADADPDADPDADADADADAEEEGV